jgi:outer membrane protein
VSITHAVHSLRRGARLLLAALLLLPAGLPAQGGAVREGTLSLEEARQLARANNPSYLARRNDEAVADWAVREAYGSFLPGVTASGAMQYQAAGEPRFGLFTGGDLGFSRTPAYYFSDYQLGLSMRLSGQTLFRVGESRAQADAVRRTVNADGLVLDLEVTRQYLAVLRSADAVVLARQELERATETQRLAEARVAVGAGIVLDSKQAELERGRAEVVLLEAEAAREAERLRLSELLGVELGRGVALVALPGVAPVTARGDDLVARALAVSPVLLALRAEERASREGVRSARSQYLPTLDLSAGWNGFTRQAGDTQFLIDQARRQANSSIQGCEALNEVFRRLADPLPPGDCLSYALTPDAEQRIIDNNRVFPFAFSKQPFSAQVRVSVPVFTGFTRQRQTELARAQAEDARLRVRGEELRLRTAVARAHDALVMSERRVELEARNRVLAEEQHELARERYRLGATSFLELKEAETLRARVERAYLDARYAHHEALAALETTIGERLNDVAR